MKDLHKGTNGSKTSCPQVFGRNSTKKRGEGNIVIVYVPKAGQISSTNVDTERRLCMDTYIYIDCYSPLIQNLKCFGDLGHLQNSQVYKRLRNSQ